MVDNEILYNAGFNITPSKYSVSFIVKKIKGRSSRILRQKFPHLKEWCESHLWAVITVRSDMDGVLWKNILQLSNRTENVYRQKR
ncbi:MAG: hypothetical protein CVV36_10130 [Candidatus Methanoperedenaceae archaeon HGW-Methanoperedenaceae-1]|jgi:hypothetical protein|nr:MAG: hypothetical protein CVV36_10130 [Candidatus Methanoperedenaceae archaeon HGW-Methanoperedenaceae-1]